jgi:hypothetical protein
MKSQYQLRFWHTFVQQLLANIQVSSIPAQPDSSTGFDFNVHKTTILPGFSLPPVCKQEVLAMFFIEGLDDFPAIALAKMTGDVG